MSPHGNRGKRGKEDRCHRGKRRRKAVSALLPSGSEQHEVLLFQSIYEGILQACH